MPHPPVSPAAALEIPTEGGRLVELDGMRGIAVLLVLIHHYVTGLLPAGLPPLFDVFRRVTAPFFLSGVDLFFVISGFIVGGIVIDGYAEQGFFRRFYIRRVTRILPLYFCVYAIFVLTSLINRFDPNPTGLWLVKDNMPLWSYAIFMQNYFMAFAGHAGGKLFAMAWSVATEEHFYLFFPLLLWWAGLKRSIIVCCGLLVVCPLIRMWTATHLTYFAAYVPFPARADSIAFGVLVAVAARQRIVRDRLVQAAGLVALVLSGALLVLVGAGAIIIDRALSFSVVALFYSMLILVAVVGRGLGAQALRSPVLMFFGATSYAIYMFHQGISGLLFAFLAHRAPRMESAEDLAIICLGAGLTIGLAYLSTRYFEQPIRRYGYRLTPLHSP